VLELVEGPTLADRIGRGPIPLDEALPIAKQIAAALEAAHEQGIVHRDLKPANIKVRPDGTVKVLDFGLAKVRAGEVVGHALSLLEREAIGGTRSGAILGTTAYMSPEQARGLPVDQQTDVWAFGCVLYEMLSGRSAFGGKTFSDTVAGILEHEPDWRALPGSTPGPVRELLRQCLRKDLHVRLRDVTIARQHIEDASTQPRGRRTVVDLLRLAAGAMLGMMIVAAMWWQPWTSGPLIERETASPQQYQPASIHEPVTIVIADFRNNTSDPVFDRTLEVTLRRALDEAAFISAFDRSGIGMLGVRRDTLDEEAARALAVENGLDVVLSGSIENYGGGYEISVKAVRTVTGQEVAIAIDRASRKEQVLAVVTQLAIAVRRALGDATPPRDQFSALRSVSAGSLEVVRHYGAAAESQSEGRYEEARQHLLNALDLDPRFGPGYQALSIMSRNLGEPEAAEKYIKEALQNLETMTERERLSTRGFYYRLTTDYQQCAKLYAEMTARYPADVVAHNQRALCLLWLRDLSGAVDEVKQAVQILPKRQVLRFNLAALSAYAGDFQAAEREAEMVQPPDEFAMVALAFAQWGQGDLQAATETYQKLADISRGASWAASGLAELALYEGRFSEAARLYEQGAAADLASQNQRKAARKFAALAYAQLWRGQKDLAIAAAQKALVHEQTGAIRFLAARAFVQAGAVASARTEAARISLGRFVDEGPSGAAGGPAAEPEAYAKIIEAEIALAEDDPRQAIKLLTEANTLADTWLGHFDLGLAYLQVPAFAQADAEFELCLKRRGEAMSLFFDEEPTYGFFPPVFYYQGIAREGLNRAESVESFAEYMSLRGKSTEDPLVLEARRRAKP
jgi:tetratricopeptide (TPR) repeat protein